jgi:hypothetical protein
VVALTRGRALLALAGVLTLAACSTPTAGTSQQPRSLPSVTPQAVPALWSVHADSAQGYALAFPDAWDFVFRDSRTLDADLKTVRNQSPEMGKYFSDGFAKNDQLRLIAADPRSLQAGFAVNVNVMVGDLGSASAAPTLDELTAAKLKLLGQQQDVGKPVKRSAVKLAGLPAARLDYTLSAGGLSVEVRSFVATFERGGRRYVAVLTMGEPAGGTSTTFDDLARGFLLFSPGKPPALPSPSAIPDSQSTNSG